MVDGQKDFGQTDGVKLRDYIEARMSDQLKYVESRLCEIQKATALAASAVDYRMSNLNELRTIVNDVLGQMITRKEMDVIVDKLTSDINGLERFRATQEGKASQQSVNVATLLSILGLLIGAVSLIMRLTGS